MYVPTFANPVYPLPPIVTPLSIGNVASVSDIIINSLGLNVTTKPAYIGWLWEKRRTDDADLQVSKGWCKYKIGDQVSNPTIQYKDDDDNWYEITDLIDDATGAQTSLTQDNTVHSCVFNIPLQGVRGLRVHADSFDYAGTATTFDIYSLYIREGIITSPAIYLGSITQAIFNAGYKEVAADKANWGVVGEDGDTTYGVAFWVWGADTEANLDTMIDHTTGEAITTGQDIFVVLGATYKWVKWEATLRCKSDVNTYNTAYPQLNYINIEGLTGGALYNQPHSIRFEERLMWSFPDRDVASFILVYDRLGNFQKHEDKCHLTKMLIFDELLYGAKSGTSDGNEVVKYDSSSLVDNGLPITCSWKTKTYYAPSVEQWVECVKGFVSVKNNMVGGTALLNIKESITGATQTLTIEAGVSEQIYPFQFPIGTLGSCVNFELSFTQDIEVLQFAVELNELKPKEF